jgi:hypothetical protein
MIGSTAAPECSKAQQSQRIKISGPCNSTPLLCEEEHQGAFFECFDNSLQQQRHTTNENNLILEWSIEERDLVAVQNLLGHVSENLFVSGRIEDNLSGPPPQFSREEFWRVMLGCLVTTQQRSGPGSRVHQFLRRTPFEPALHDCSIETAELTISAALRNFGGLRRHSTIARQAAANLRRLEGDWARVEAQFETLLILRAREPQPTQIESERTAAVFMQDFKGFGPKQSRNLWQWLGLTRFEIPLDSRVIRWFNQSRVFPFILSAKALSDEYYYRFVMTGIQRLCASAHVLPCVLDAAIFARDEPHWTQDDLDY